MKHTATILLAAAIAAQSQDIPDAPDRPWSATLELLRPVGTDSPLEGSLGLSRAVDLSDLVDGVSVTPGVSGTLGTTDTDTTWSVSPSLGIAWETDDLTVSVGASSAIRSWDATDYAASAGLGYQLTPTASIGASAGTALHSGEWAKCSFDWSRPDGEWETGASLGLGYLWDVAVTSQGGKGNRTDNVRTTYADQWQLAPSAQISRRMGAVQASVHLDGDLRTYEITKSSGGKGKKAATRSTASQAMQTYSITVDPWAGIGWSFGSWGIDLSGGWSQSYGTGASEGGAWASLSSSFSW